MASASAPIAGPSAGPDSPPPGRGRKASDVITGVVGVTGELFITAGVLLGLFVVWQLFYTDVTAARIQGAALDTIAWSEDVGVPRGSIAAPSAEPSEDTIQLIPDSAKVYNAQGAPVIDQPAELTTFGVLYVPRWGYDYARPITEGTSRSEVLDKLGIGHYPQTAMPGAIGNFAIAGHRTTYGKPFTDIQTLQEGDALVVQTETAWYVYKVTGSTIVLPEQGEVIAPVPNDPFAEPTVASITLTTCHPKFSAEKRYIVWGELEYWAPSGLGYPAEIVEGA